MDYFLQGNNVLYRDKAGQMMCSKISWDWPSKKPISTFIEKDFYQNKVSSVLEILKRNRKRDEADTLFLNTEFYRHPGLIETIAERYGTAVQVKSDIEFEVSLYNPPPGKYTFTEISKDETSTFLISVEKEAYSIEECLILPNEQLIQRLSNCLKDYLLPNIHPTEVAEVIFDYSNILAINGLLTDDNYGLVGNETAYNDRNLYFRDSAFKTIFTTDLVLPVFFDAISTCLSNHLKNITVNGKAIIQSPLLDYSRVKLIEQQEAEFSINRLNQILKAEAVCLKAKKSTVKLDIDSYPATKQVDLPFSSWILSEASNLLFNCKFNDKHLVIDMSSLNEKIANTFFTVGRQSLVKYSISIGENSCGTLQFKMRDLNGIEYFKAIHD